MAATKKSYLALTEVEQLAQHCAVPGDKVHDMLRYFHKVTCPQQQ